MGMNTRTDSLLLSCFVLHLITTEKIMLLLAVWCDSQQLSVNGAVKETSFMCTVG